MKWIDCLFQHRRARFCCLPWLPGEAKELVVLRFLSEFCWRKRLSIPSNVVVFLDFDSDHAKARIQNTVRETGRIARCYHLDSTNNDCIQCCDLLLGATCTMNDDPAARLNYENLLAQHEKGQRLKDSQVKQLLAGHLAKWVDGNAARVYDLRVKESR